MDLSTLQKDARFFALGDSNNTAYGNTDLNRNLNAHYEIGVALILAIGDWQVRGEIGTKNIVADTREYLLPSDILRLNEVYIKYESDGKYYKAKQRDPKNISIEPDQDDYGYYPFPPEFDLLENSIRIYIPNKTISAVTEGLKIHYQKEITQLINTDDEPILAKPFRRYISLGAAYDYCLAQGTTTMERKAKNLFVLQEQAKKEMIEFYAKRAGVRKLNFNIRKEEYN